jgi:hypothetical protein
VRWCCARKEAFWSLVVEPSIFTTLRRDTVSALTHAYNRMSTSNEQAEQLFDLLAGPTAVLVHSSVAGRLSDAQVRQVYEQFVAARDERRDKLLDRLANLKPFLDGCD